MARRLTTCSTGLVRGRFMPRFTTYGSAIGAVICAAIFGFLSGCSKHPDLAGVYFLPSNYSDSQWSTDSLLELREDGTATVEGITFHFSGASQMYSEVATRGKGTWWVEADKVVFEGEIATASTFGEKDHQGSEPMRLVFRIAGNGDLFLSDEDMASDSVRFIKEK